MTNTIIMPQGGQDIEKGRVVTWLKSEGDQVSKGEVICEVETEKAVFEVEAPADGQLLRIIVGEGEEAPIFSALGYIGAAGEIIPEESKPTAAEVGKQVEKPEQAPPAHKMREKVRGGPVVSPRAKRLADEKGIKIEDILGSGPGGRITEKDVLGNLEAESARATGSSIATPEHGRIVPMSRIGKVTARKMRQSKQTVPHFYVSLSVDMTKALRFRTSFNDQLRGLQGELLSITDLIARSCVLAFQEYPELNCTVMDEVNLILWDDLNIGIAVAVESELVVPVIPGIDRLTLGEIAEERQRLVNKAKVGKQSSLEPSRFTISNLGMFNIDQFIAIINPPETAILAVSSIVKRPVALDAEQVGLRDTLTLTLSIDHRAADGVLACQFLNFIRTVLESPELLKG